jgi:hypothetical protein
VERPRKIATLDAATPCASAVNAAMTSNIFRKNLPALTTEDVRTVEEQVKIKLPDEVKSHYLAYNGGVPQRPCWQLEDGEFHRVGVFLPMKYGLAGGRTVETVYAKGTKGGYLTKDLIPFANDEGGNYFCFNPHGEIFFYAMDIWDKNLSDDENRRKAIEPLTHSFSAFVD